MENALDWKQWTRSLERKRRALARLAPRRGRLPMPYLARVTRASFLLDRIELNARELADALRRGAAARPVRSRQAQRVRNHVAVLRRIEGLVARGVPLTAETIVRWYTSVACGLSIGGLDDATLARLDHVARRINSPHLNLRPALEDAAAMYRDLLADAIVPSFNGLLVRLLIGCHFARCGLPPVLFDPTPDSRDTRDTTADVRRLVVLMDQSYDALLASARPRIEA